MRLVFRRKEEEDYPSDIDRIVTVCAARGFEISRNDARLAWEEHSESMCAGWLFLPESDDDLFEEIRRLCVELE